MAPRRTSASTPAQLLAHLLSPSAAGTGTDIPSDRLADGLADALADELAGWLSATPRFLAFADAHRDKIRRKLRQAHDPDARADVRAELLVARRLLADRSVELGYEAAGDRGAGPDFNVTYRGGRPFNLEVTRPRMPAHPNPTRIILAKLRQLPAGSANVLLLAVSGDVADWEVAGSLRAVRVRADAKEEEFFTRRGFTGTRDFYDRFLRLSAVLTWSEAGAVAAWRNGSARIAVPERAFRACLAALA